jgi:hypothetical protein
MVTHSAIPCQATIWVCGCPILFERRQAVASLQTGPRRFSVIQRRLNFSIEGIGTSNQYLTKRRFQSVQTQPAKVVGHFTRQHRVVSRRTVHVRVRWLANAAVSVALAQRRQCHSTNRPKEIVALQRAMTGAAKVLDSAEHSPCSIG